MLPSIISDVAPVTRISNIIDGFVNWNKSNIRRREWARIIDADPASPEDFPSSMAAEELADTVFK